MYSIIIPAYNEGERLAASLDAILRFLAEERWQAEVLVVNDGSRDGTADIVGEYARADARIRLLQNPGNRGKGYSVRHGMTEARGDYLLFTDADLSSPIAEGKKLFAALDAGADLAIGSRWLDSSTQTERQSRFRQLAGRAFNLLLRIILGLRYKDTQCGFKAFTAVAARRIFPCQRIERWGFDPEILFLARKSGLRVVEVPVAWAHDERSKIHPLSDGPRMFWEMLRVRWNDWTGKYEPATPALAARRG
jgi:glycosyltransferase involved in cell wall biosynthesis